jgi:glycosyltransferase involved in cell wall biosynthesis
MPAHLCHILASFDPGGFELRTVGLMNALGGRVRHTIVATNGAYGAAERIRPDVSIEILPPPPGKGRLSYALPLARLLRRVQPDLVLTYNWGAIDGVLAALIARVCPVLHAEDGFGPEEAHALKMRRVLMRRLLLKGVYATVVPSRVLMNIARDRFGVPPAKLIYIPNGVDTDRFRPGLDRRWRRAHGIPDDAVLCGTVGRLRPEKNLELLLRAFARAGSSSLRLAIAGDGPDRTDLERQAHALDLDGRVVFAGNLTDPVPFYRALDFFVMSSVTEQMPVALLEAMACGLPVLATDVGDIREMLNGCATPGTLVPSSDLEAYVSGLMKLASDLNLRAELGSKNRQTVLDRYTAKRMVARYRATYEAAMRRPLGSLE